VAIRVIRKGNASANNDHSLLFNIGLPNQHPIEAITGLKEALAEKYVKPATGIPPTDLGFNVVTQEDLHNVETLFDEKFIVVDGEIVQINSDIQSIRDFLNNNFGNGSNGTPGGATINFAYRNGFREEFISQDGDTDFYLINTFIADNKHLRVYRDGELLTPGVDYIEVTNNHIQMLYPLDEGVYMTLICETLSTVVSPVHEEIISILDQTEFNLQNEYVVGQNTLSIFVKGLRLELGTDYEEVAPYQIKLLQSPYPAGTKFIFRQESVQSAGTVMYHEMDYQQKTWSLDFVATEGQTVISLSETYIPGTNMIMVAVDGLVQWPGSEFDYMEIDETHIQFNYPLEAGEKVKVTCIAALCNWNERFVTLDNQDTIHLTNIYNVGKNDIMVYENGLQLCVGDDYIELNNRTIKLLEPPPFGSKITVFKRR
jgi:hypothetical protein